MVALVMVVLLAASIATPVAATTPASTSLTVSVPTTEGIVNVGVPFSVTLSSDGTGVSGEDVDFMIDGLKWATATTPPDGVLGGRAYKFTTAGSHTVSARYQGSNSYAASLAEPVTVTIAPAPTIVVTPSPAIVVFDGETNVTLTATVTPNLGGAIRWSVNGSSSSPDFALTTLDSNGQASWTTGRASYFGEDWGHVPYGGQHYWVSWIPDGASIWATSTLINVDTTWPAHIGIGVNPGPYAATLVAGQTLSVDVGANPRTGPEGDRTRVFGGTTSVYDTFDGIRTKIADVATPAVIGHKFEQGDHLIEAIYAGNGDYSAETVTSTFAVQPDGSVDASGIGLSATSVYPYKDGYKDSVSLIGTRAEATSVTAKVYNSTNHVVRTLSGSTGIGPYSIKWNGRTAGGTWVASGKYRIVQTLKDASGHSLRVTKYINVSHKRLYWYSKTVVKPGYAACCETVDGGSLSANDSSYYHGLLIDGNQYGDSAQVGYSFTLVSATKYSNLSFKVLGKSAPGRGTALVFFNRYNPSDYGPYKTAGRAYGWYTTTVSPTGYYSSTRHVRGYILAQGSNLGAFDVSKVELVYKYALLK
jgi:hypothetical protein